MIGISLLLTAAPSSGTYSPGYELAAADAANESLGGCGWSRCVKCQGGPCGPTNQKCIANPSKPVYTFHLADPTCDINDPNGPMYDPVHGVYHNFYQIHIAEDMNGAGDGPDWGHWVSKDFVHWAQLPVAIWNDQYYDNSAIFTGSTTIVDGKPVMMYPGKCNSKGIAKGQPACNDGKGGFTYVLVVPTNASDPLYTEWSKEGSIGGKTFSNPVVNSTGDDPSTAWQTSEGEWRIIGNQGCAPEGGNPMYGSEDFVSWYKIGCTTLMAGDCPTFFALPGLTPGSEHYVERHLQDGPMPDHVHKSGGHGGDQTQVGQWVNGKKGPEGTGTVGTWTLTPGSKSVLLDRGKTHASKDFYDPVKKRQVMWLWGTVTSGIQTVPRDMTYHPGIKQIVYAPVEEMDTLHTRQLDTVAKSSFGSKGPSIKASAACDISLVFVTPTAATTISVAIGGGLIFFSFTPAPAEAAATRSPWTCNVGFMVDGKPSFADTVPLLADDASLALRIFLDGSVAEAYWMGGRTAMTIPTSTVETVALSSTATVTLTNATSYQMGDIHTTKEAVLATPRQSPAE